MASAPPPSGLPLFYKDLVPLNASEHASWHSRSTNKATWLVNQHAVPLTVEEFPMAQRHYPIIFSIGDEPVPLALMGMNEGVNAFVDDEGTFTTDVYVPAYVRRYPFMLAKLRPDAEELSLCFDPTSDLLGAFQEGVPLFEGTDPSEACKASLSFCEQFEIGASKTGNFIAELQKHELLIESEVNLQLASVDQPFNYRGFQMVDEKKLRDLRGDVLRGWSQNGLLPLIYAHIFSLDLMRELFARQVQLGKGPIPAQVEA